MKRVLNYLACTALLFVAVLFLCGGGLWSLCGFVWCGLLYVSGEIYPKFWKSFWVSNSRIISYFDCL